MSKKKNNENKWLSVGNFLIGIDTNAHGSHLVLKSALQNWQIRWREDTMMYVMMMNVIKTAAENDNMKEYLHSLITVMFVATTYTHDLVALATKQEMPFCEGIAKLLKEQTDYEDSIAQRKEPTAEDDEKALNEVVEMREVEEELEKLDAENNE